MKTVANNKISTRLTRRILLRDIAARIKTMSDAVNGDTDVFTGVQPFNAVAIAAIIATFLSTQSAFKVGGSMKKMAFIDAKKAIYACILAFAPYIDGVAKGNNVILKLSTLETLEDEIDVPTLIAEGGVAANITAKQGKFPRTVDTSCSSFAEGVGYIVILSEGELSADFTVNNLGQISNPSGSKVFINFLKGNKKTFTGLLPKTEYFAYYILTFGNTVGIISAGVSVVTSA